MEIQLIRTDEDLEWAKKLISLTVEELLKKTPKREPYYRLNNPEIKNVFPDVSTVTLQRWCTAGKLGKLFPDGCYYIKISELEKFLLK